MKKMSGVTSMAAIHLVMGMESKQKKTKILVVSIVIGVICLIFGALFLARFSSVQSLQSASQDFKDALGSSYKSPDISFSFDLGGGVDA
jgi:vacuolar-type H+-ATPase subunit I/STV1